MAKKGNKNPAQANLRTQIGTSTDKKEIMQAALRMSLTGGSFLDTKFYAFSRKRSTGIVDEPRPVYANSALLRASSKYFDGFFEGSFTEAKFAPLRGKFPSEKSTFTEEYDYDSDSDLEDEASAADVRKPDDSDLKSEASHESKIHTPRTQADALPTEGDTSNYPPVEPSGLGLNVENYGRVIVMPDIAFATWQALIFWIYTGEIVFAPLRSKIISQEDGETKPKPASTALQCSPKSIYRAADKCGLEDLKTKALEDIRSQLSKENIVIELQSTLTSTYEKIREMEVEFACQSARPVVLAAVPQWITDMAAGNLVHTADTLSAVYQKSASATTTSSPAAPPHWNVNRCGSCRRQNTLNMSAWYRYCNSCGGYNTPYA